MEGNKKAKALWGFFRKPVSKKTFENVAIVVIICIIAIIAAGNFMRDGEKSVNEPAAAAGTEKPGESQSYETDDAWSYEKDLENILSKIKGVGNVDVMITFASTVEDVPAFYVADEVETRKLLQLGMGCDYDLAPLVFLLAVAQ